MKEDQEGGRSQGEEKRREEKKIREERAEEKGSECIVCVMGQARWSECVAYVEVWKAHQVWTEASVRVRDEWLGKGGSERAITAEKLLHQVAQSSCLH